MVNINVLSCDVTQNPRFMEEVDREISEMKLSLNARARTVAESYLTAVSSPCLRCGAKNLISPVVQFMSRNPYRGPLPYQLSSGRCKCTHSACLERTPNSELYHYTEVNRSKSSHAVGYRKTTSAMCYICEDNVGILCIV